MSPEREGRDVEEEEGEREGGRTNFAFDMDSETAGLRGNAGGPRNGGTLRSLMVGNQRRKGSSETDIVSDIYTTAFSKVPKVRILKIRLNFEALNQVI